MLAFNGSVGNNYREREHGVTNRLTGKTVVIAGAAGGQGRAGAVMFAREGANLALCDIDERGLRETADLVAQERSDVEVLTGTVDMTVMSDIATFVRSVDERYKAIDVIYNNAGVNHLGAIEDVTEADWQRVYDINLKAGFFLVKYALPGLKASAGASIINVSSGSGLLAPADGNGLYCASKGGLISLTRAQARDLAPYGIRVNCLLPGPIETAMVRRFFANMPEENREAAQMHVVGRSLFKRFGQPDEVAAVAVFLATDEASYISATIIPVDAGWVAM
jgi:NAD(P)-dependent dehydrogenase (short-subunit alcohol dehydrogenase family)